MARPDPKQGKRIIDKKAVEAKMMDELQCRACGPNGISSHGSRVGRLEAHHLVNRSQLGDDVPENIVALCPVCHFTFTHEGGSSARMVARRIRSNLSQSERGYVVRKKSFEWLEQHYPRFEASDRTGWPVLSEGEKTAGGAERRTSGSAGDQGISAPSPACSPSESTPSSAEPRNREVREGHPSVLVSSADKPEGVEQPLGVAAPPSGAGIPTVTPYWLEPGSECPTCHNRVPRPKKEGKPPPDTKPCPCGQMPTDEIIPFKEQLLAGMQKAGCAGRAYPRKVLVYALLEWWNGDVPREIEQEIREFVAEVVMP